VRNDAKLAVAFRYGNPNGEHNALALNADPALRANAIIGADRQVAEVQVPMDFWACRNINVAHHDWMRPGAEDPGVPMADVQRTRIYASRYEVCGFDEKSRQKPWSYCDRVITRENNPERTRNFCPHRFRVGINGDGSYATYTSVPLCGTTE
jgi:hypothetical protein